MSASLKERETRTGKTLQHKDKSSLVKTFVNNYRAAVGMLSYIQGSTQPEI